MNRGLMIFKRLQRLQQGTAMLEPGPLPPEKRRIGPKELAGLYDPGPGAPLDDEQEYYGLDREQPDEGDLAHLTPEEQLQEQVDWEKNIKEILLYTPDLTPEERKQVQELNPKDWDDSTREKVGQASEMAGKAMPLRMGTSNVGLRLYMAKRELKKPKPRKNQKQ